MDWRYKAVAVAISLGAGVIGGVIINHHASFRQVQVQVAPGLSVGLYKDTGGGGAFNYNSKSQPLASLTSSQTLRLQDGAYDAVVRDPSHEFANPVVKLIVMPGTNSVTVDPAYTDAKLASLLPSVQPVIVAALDAKYPALDDNYTITNGHLYENGDWYGALLAPNASINDLLRVIMHKEGGTWKVATDPPEISIGEPAHPDIPSDVVESVDLLGSGS